MLCKHLKLLPSGRKREFTVKISKLKLYLMYRNEKYFTFLAFSSSQVVPPFCWLIHFLVRCRVPLTSSVPRHDLEHWLQDDQGSIFAWIILFTSTVAAVITVLLLHMYKIKVEKRKDHFIWLRDGVRLSQALLSRFWKFVC